MKYQFNEQELLSLFYDKEDDLRPDITAPYLKNGYVCATESHVLIKIKAETLNGEYDEIPSCNIDWPDDNCNFIVSLQEIETTLSNIPQVEEEEMIGEDIVCEECDGLGNVDWEYEDKAGDIHYTEHDCPKCCGSGLESRAKYRKTGQIIPDMDCLVRVRRVVLRAEFLEILSKAMRLIGVDKVRCIHQAPAKPCIFRVDENIDIIIMPCSAEADYRIEGDDAE